MLGGVVAAAVSAAQEAQVKMRAVGLTVRYCENVAVREVGIDVHDSQVLALIGPSGCGKSTFLRCLNRMNDTISGVSIDGQVELDGEPIYRANVDPVLVRRRVGMVFQRSNPFPKSIFENVAYGLRIAGVRERGVIAERVERALRHAALWEEVKDRLQESGLGLSGGQQQRLCIARAVAVKPEVLLLDEPASALDPISTQKIEQLITELKADYTIAVVTHNMQQAARASDFPAFMYLGELIEFNQTPVIFTRPEKKQTEDYVTGRFG